MDDTAYVILGAGIGLTVIITFVEPSPPVL